jgi:hypothetical protein
LPIIVHNLEVDCQPHPLRRSIARLLPGRWRVCFVRVMNSVERLQAAHARWLEAQREAARLVAGANHPGTPADWAEGFRWVNRMAAIAFDWVVEKNDAMHPVIFKQQDEYRKFIVDNPDVNYHFCVLDHSRTYRLSGNRGEAPYVGFTFGTDVFRWGSGGEESSGTLTQCHLDEFEIRPNGDFEIVISPQPQPGNWIKLEPRTQHLAVRETFTRRDRQRPAAFAMELLGDPLPPPQLAPDDYAKKLELAASFLLFVVRTCIAMWAGSAANVNCFSGAAGSQHVEDQEHEVDTHCSTEMAYMGGRWKIEPGTALRVRVAPPRKPFVYWGLVLVNPWSESYDYRFAQTCLNNETAERADDGAWELVIAAENPGAANWLDTGGRLEGQMLLRWVLADRPPLPRCELVPLAELRV